MKSCGCLKFFDEQHDSNKLQKCWTFFPADLISVFLKSQCCPEGFVFINNGLCSGHVFSGINSHFIRQSPRNHEDRHPFNVLFSKPTWVSQHQNG